MLPSWWFEVVAEFKGIYIRFALILQNKLVFNDKRIFSLSEKLNHFSELEIWKLQYLKGSNYATSGP